MAPRSRAAGGGADPAGALLDAAEHALQLEGFSCNQVLERRLGRPPISESVSLGGPRRGRGGDPPGGGRWAAVTGALASARGRWWRT
jgi:hypothetical protein